MSEKSCSAFGSHPVFCNNGFARKVSCSGISINHIIQPCVDEKFLDSIKRSSNFFDDSGFPKMIKIMELNA
jgi:hypothetical protein